jgi:hypothetical protein
VSGLKEVAADFRAVPLGGWALLVAAVLASNLLLVAGQGS